MRKEAPGKAWRPIEGLPNDAHTWRNEPYDRAREEWREVKAALARRGTDRYALEQWLREQRRAFAIENGQIEQLYTLRRGVTEQLIVEGLECEKWTPIIGQNDMCTPPPLVRQLHAALGHEPLPAYTSLGVLRSRP